MNEEKNKDEMDIPVVFAANDNYVVFSYVAVYSLIKHTSPSNKYKIYILETDITEKNRGLLEGLTQDNVEVKCVDISRFTANVELKASLHLSQETYYRLWIPLIFPEYEKIIYLDSDMCILADVAELYEAETGNYPVGAVRDVACHTLQDHTNSIGLADVKETFNAGVLLINTVEFEKQGIREKCLALLAEDYQREKRKLIFADQDALNVVLYKNHYRLDEKWNYQPMYLGRMEEVLEGEKEKYISAQDHAGIMHFSGDRKPWYNLELPKADVFWKWAKEADAIEMLVSKLVTDIRNKEENISCFDNFRFPYGQIPYNSKIVIYGAGRIGKTFYYQLKATEYARIVLWVDRDWKNLDAGFGIEPIEKIKDTDFDYLIIAIESFKIAEDVRKMLMDLHIPGEKLVWDEYRKI